MRKIRFASGEYYHIYNCGVEQRKIFENQEDYLRFLRCIKDFNNKSYYEERIGRLKELSSFLVGLEKIVEILAFSLNSNHFHLIIKQLTESGISNFMHKIGTSFTNYFNKKYNRSGSLFQGSYKAIHIDSDEYLLWLSAYVNGNIEIHGIERAGSYSWSSYRDFLYGKKSEILGDIDIILSQFENADKYKDFIERVIKESKDRKEIKKYLLE